MTDNGKIPFLDLVSLHRDMEEDLVSVFRSILRTGGFVGGPIVEKFEKLRTRLAQANITTQVHYPTPLHFQRAHASLGYKEGDFPVTERAAKEILSLPMYPQLKRSQQKQIVEAVMESLEGSPVRGRSWHFRPLAPIGTSVS